MYYDLIENAFATSSDSNMALAYPEIECFGQRFAVTLPSGSNISLSAATTTIIMSDNLSSPNLCAKVTIAKYDSDGDGYSDRTTILSRGNNYCDGNKGRLLERGIRIRY
jgi:hypothetical protein